MINNSREIIRKSIEKANKPLAKYNFPLLEDTAELSGEPSDRTAYDVGSELEAKNI